jgi:acetyl esterase/lipase
MKAVLCLLLLAGCGTAPSNSYTAASTYAKLAAAYPKIRIASQDVPDTVTALRGITYVHGLQLDLYLPSRPSSSPIPGIVFVHGGGWRSGTRDNLAPIAIRMAVRGYACAAISYRLSSQARYPAALNDVKAALRWMSEQGPAYGIDPGRVATAGASAGGQLASLAGVTDNRVRAVVNIDGLSDFTSPEALLHEDDPAKNPSAAGAWFGGRYAEKSALWRAASPTFYVSPKTPPILFIGSGEARFSAGREAMVAKMKANGVASRVVLMPGTPHSFWLFDPWLEPTVDAMATFLDEHLLRIPAAAGIPR